ncbi:MAG: hypothetical protein ACOC0U_05805, partial [Desulfovibrionales bacterium]
RLGSSFDFSYSLSESNEIKLEVQPCGLLQAVKNAGEKPGESVLCLLFHEYWAALISSFTNKPYSYKMQQAGEKCSMTLHPME